MIEIWKDIPNYENCYQVSNLGNVKSLDKLDTLGRRVKGKLMKAKIRKDGYLEVTLRKNNHEKHYLIHRLVAMTFIDNMNNYKEINHKDENKTNNNVNNLEWCNRSYNINYGTGNEKRRKTLLNNKRSKKVCQYDLDGNLINIYVSLRELERQTDYSISYISSCCNNKQKTYKKYIWKYE